ncbi:MAG: HEAT repeat domain-containing protein [bacterium]
MKRLAAVLKNMKTYEPDSPVIEKSLEILMTSLTEFLSESESLTLLVKEDTISYGDSVCYRCEDKTDCLAFALFRDGIRLLTFRRGLSAREVREFARAVNEARKADPYQADLVTILWEKDLANIGYRAVDAYLEEDERQTIRDLALKCTESQSEKEPEGGILSPETVFNELGLSIDGKTASAGRRPRSVNEMDSRDLIQEMLEEDETNLLKRCSEICAEIANTSDTDEMFNSVVSHLGRICESIVSSGDFLSACSIVSDLRLLASDEETSAARRASIMDTISMLGERRAIRSIGDQLGGLNESRLEEVFAYLALMAPTAVKPLCDLLAESEEKKVRYLLCRAISIAARTEPDRLRPFMNDQRWFVVRNMVMIAGMIGGPTVIPLLRLAASHREARVRKELARSLGRARSEAGLDLLRDFLQDENKSVRLAAISALQEIGSDQVMSVLETVMLDESFGKRPKDEKREIAVAYGSLGMKSFDLLKSIITGEVTGYDDETRASAVYGLAKIGNGECLEFLKGLRGAAGDSTRQAAAEAIVDIEAYQDLKGYHAERTG